MKAWEIVGWAHDGELYCCDCAPGAGLPEGEEAQEEAEWGPMFADEECDCIPRCEKCGCAIEGPALTEEGRKAEFYNWYDQSGTVEEEIKDGAVCIGFARYDPWYDTGRLFRVVLEATAVVYVYVNTGEEDIQEVCEMIGEWAEEHAPGWIMTEEREEELREDCFSNALKKNLETEESILRKRMEEDGSIDVWLNESGTWTESGYIPPVLRAETVRKGRGRA